MAEDELDETLPPISDTPEDFLQAEWLANRLHHEWKFDHTAKRWHHFDGIRWAPDETDQVHRAVYKAAHRALGSDRVPELERKRMLALMQWPTQERALKALATFPGYGTNGDEWDSNAFLLGTKKGIVDLRSNALIVASPEQNVTKTTKTEFKPIADPEEFDERAPGFMRSMRQWMSGDEDMVYFLLFWFGASMFGMSPEQRFLLMTGRGRNGKGALKHSILKACGEYAEELDPSLYMRTKYGGTRSNEARADLIALKGLRITFFSEPSGGQFNEELLKAHTGSDRISARALYSNNVQSWDATHSINFLTNDLPAVEDVGPSMGERVMVADFRESYEGAARNVNLYGELEGEKDGILAILVWAASIWYQRWAAQHGGLVLPARVVEQSREFIERNDPVANWLNDRCENDPKAMVASGLAYESYLEWHTASGAPGEAFSTVKWSLTLQKKGYVKVRSSHGQRWQGLRLLGAMELADRGGLDEDEEP